MIRFDKVTKRYPGGHEALKEVAFALDPGEFVFLTGHSGAGKSTVLKLISLVERPTRGTVMFDTGNGPQTAADSRVGQLLANMALAGIAPGAVDIVAMTHFHGDHVGGLLDASGAAAFPPEYRGDAFVALHGSWNRAKRTGYKVVRLRLRDGVPTGEYEDFLTGFVRDEDSVWGRPVGVTVARDGALLVTEDGNGTVWRVAPAGH